MVLIFFFYRLVKFLDGVFFRFTDTGVLLCYSVLKLVFLWQGDRLVLRSFILCNQLIIMSLFLNWLSARNRLLRSYKIKELKIRNMGHEPILLWNSMKPRTKVSPTSFTYITADCTARCTASPHLCFYPNTKHITLIA